MNTQTIENYRIIPTNELVRAIEEVKNSSERFCFVLGSGASASSGIPTGGELEYRWMAEMEQNPGLKEIRTVAKSLWLDKRLDYDFGEIEEAWKKTKSSGSPLSSSYYFDIYKLRFFPNPRNGYHYLERIMSDAKPGFGYHPLALMLTEEKRHNLVITTNFDSLVEDALFLYTDSKPLVINHELLADFAGDPNISRPIIAKIHRGIFFDPLNRPEETNELKGKWHEVLVSVFQCYTPIIIGYGGGDNSLMELLADENVRMKNGMYWCYVEEYGLPNEKIQTLVQQKRGYLVRTAGFDATMLAIGNALFPDRIGVHETERYLNNRTNVQIENYEKEYNKLTERDESNNPADAAGKANQSENDFKKEIEKMADRGTASENDRKKSNQMTAWDYRRQGNRFYNSKQYGKAVESFSEAITEQPDIATFYNDRGCAYNFLGEYEKARIDYTRAIELNPDYAVAYNNRGYNYNCLGEYGKATADLNRAIELNSNYVEAYNNRGIVFRNLKEYEKGISDSSNAIERNPDYAEAFINRGILWSKTGEYDKAISDLDKAISLMPDSAIPYRHCGIAWKEKGELDKAVYFLSKAVEINPKYKEAYLERAKVYRLQGENEKASADEETAAKL